jgi:hypothetical protein
MADLAGLAHVSAGLRYSGIIAPFEASQDKGAGKTMRLMADLDQHLGSDFPILTTKSA